jgi:hypothetical protein
MRIHGTLLVAATLLLGLAAQGEIGTRRPSGEPPARKTSTAARTFRMPAALEENRGQTDASVRFLARARGFRAYLADRETVFALPHGTGPTSDPGARGGAPSTRWDLLRMRFVGSQAAPIVGGIRARGVVHHLLGDDPAKWVVGVPLFREVEARDLYPGVTLRWRALDSGDLEYDLVLAPGADPSAVAMRFEGAQSVRAAADGSLEIATAGGVLRHGRPVAWQEKGGDRRAVDATFAVRDDGTVGYAVRGADPALALVIDPVLTWSSFLGGSSTDALGDMTVAPDGSAVLVGSTGGSDLPVSTGAFRTSFPGGSSSAFVARAAPDGSSLAWCTYLGGSAADYGDCAAVDPDGRVTVAGRTVSTNFPTKDAVQGTRPSGTGSGYVARLAADGASLEYSTYLGGTANTVPQDVAVDAAGGALVVGYYSGSDFPTVNALQGTSGGGSDAFAVRYASSGTSVAWSTYLGGGGFDGAEAAAIRADGSVLVAGSTRSADFPTASPIQSTLLGIEDAFVATIAADGSALTWSTYLGGSASDRGAAVAPGKDGAVWVAGRAASTDFPLVQWVQGTLRGTGDGFVARIDADGSSLAFSTFLGGGGDDLVYDLAVNGAGTAYAAGYTTSSDFPVANALQALYGGGVSDGFVACFDAAGAPLRWATYFGGSDADACFAAAADASRSVLVAGHSSSANLPQSGGFQAGKSGGQDAFVAAFRVSPLPPVDCTAALTGLLQSAVEWVDVSNDESGFLVERSVDGGPFEERATLGAGTTSYPDPGLAPVTSYAYRVRAVSAEGVSGPSNAAGVTTPPAATSPPAAPTGLSGSAGTPRSVLLTWSDNSDDEDFFLLSRAEGSGLFSTRATPALGVTSFTDGTVLPGRRYSWKVRAVNPVGASVDTNTVTLTLAGTLDVALAKGKVVDKDAFAKDAVTLSGTLGYGPGAAYAAFDPGTQSFSVRFGDFEAAPLLNIPSPAEGWRLDRKGKWTWKSPKGSITKAKVEVIPSTGAWTVKLKKATLPAALANPIRVSLGAGDDAGHFEADWAPLKKPGQWKFPVPVPK